MSVQLRRLLPTALLAASLLASGCAAGHDTTPNPSGTHANSTGSHPTSAADLPQGIAKAGAQQPVDGGSWTVTLQRLERLPAGTGPSKAPAGSGAYRTRMTVTNTRPQVATAPQIALTIRYGDLGHEVLEMPAGPTSASPAAHEPVRVAPNGSVSRDVRLVLPDQAQGQRVTMTVEATPEGLAEPELLFFEDAVPGRPAAPSPAQAPGDLDRREAVTPLGQWNAGLRLSEVSLSGQGGASRRARLELSVANGTSDPLPGLGTTLRVLAGEDLHLITTIRPAYGYHDAAIAPHRTATQTVGFRIPAAAADGPVTIEAVAADGSRLTFQGRLG
ncbi:hypothetical protein ACFV3R_10090 [Streptomyces sp. NPDC059740]|uniref:hypothetical protein n=1 Tax=Streptomyces sp. NPDC059740 TaxID=3346926 RepID=UPI00364AF5A2